MTVRLGEVKGELKGELKDPSSDYSVHAQREAASKMPPDPWDEWRQQKAPEMFDAEVTHRG